MSRRQPTCFPTSLAQVCDYSLLSLSIDPFPATSYFHLPIEEDEGSEDYLTSRHITWTPSADSTDSEDSDTGVQPPASSLNRSEPRRNHKAIIQDILSENDLYHILGLQRGPRSDKIALRRAYLARSKACHPECALCLARQTIAEREVQ